MIVFGGRGGRGNEGQAQLDGLGTGAAINGGGVSGYGQLEIAQEVVLTTAGGLGEAEVGGPVVNLIPKTGGNTFQHHFYGSGMSGWMQSEQLHPGTEGPRHDVSPQKTIYLWDNNLSSGGPVKKDRLWFFFNLRHRAAGNDLPGMYYNKNAGDRTKWLYEPDFSRPASNGNAPGTLNPTLRLTAQVTSRDKLNMFWDPGTFRLKRHRRDRRHQRPGRGRARDRYRRPDGRKIARLRADPVYVDADEPAAGRGRPRRLHSRTGTGASGPDNNRDLIQVTEQCTERLSHTTATSRAWSIARRTGIPTAWRRTGGTPRRPMSPAPTT